METYEGPPREAPANYIFTFPDGVATQSVEEINERYGWLFRQGFNV